MILLPELVRADFEVDGKLQPFAGTYLSSQPEDVTSHHVGIETELETQYRFSPFRFQFEVWSKYDATNESEKDTFQAELDELSLEWRDGGRKIKIGWSIRSWEGTDLINPMDVIHSKNFNDPLDSRNRSAPGLFYNDAVGDFAWDLTYLYEQQKTRLPGTNSPWWPRKLYLPIENDQILLRLPETLEYRITNGEVIDEALSHNVAARVQYHGSQFDISLAGFEGSSSPPLLIPVVNVVPIEVSPRTIYQLQSPIQIDPVYYRQRAVAFAVVWTAGSWIFRASGNHVQPLGDDPRLPTWSQLGVLGVEKTFYFKSQMLTLLGQAVASHRPDSGSLSFLSSLYENSYMLGVRWAPSEKLTWLQAVFQEQENFSYFYHIEANWSFKEAWSLILQADFFQGSPESVLGTYSENDQVFLKTSYSF